MTQTRNGLHLPEIANLRVMESNLNRDSCEGIKMPLSVMDKVTQVRNKMHQTHLRQAKQKLHNEINQTMKMYSSEKHQLLKQLASLRHDLTDLKLPEISPRTYDPYQTPRVDPKQYTMKTRTFLNSAKHRGKMHTNSKKLIVKCDMETSDYESDFEKSLSDTDHNFFGDDIDKDMLSSTIQDDQLVLPSINVGSTRWYSGKNLRHSSLDNATKKQTIERKHDTIHYPEISPKQISMLSVHDSQRCEIKLPTIKGINKKKVKFDGKTAVKLIPSQMQQRRGDKMADNSQQKKQRSEKLPSVEGYKIKKDARVQLRGRKSPIGIYLPPIKQYKKKRTREVLPETLTESAEWKALYLNIQDPEKRQKTLSDILHAVRIRMQRNEKSLKFGERRSPEKTDNSLCDYLLNTQRNQQKKERVMNSHIPSHAAERCFRRSNAIQLQNYLHNLSKQRRMIEHMAGEEYRLAHFVGHKHLQDVLPM